MVYLLTSPVWRIGVQTVYYYGGEGYPSQISWLQIGQQPSSVESISSESPIVRTKYFDLSGRSASQPSQGI
ncbi:MAG: hypothetical protein LIP03_00045 [Bacteroidales bacterium]|nr:hypothetical protein [Bacteroidales bacterium]